MARFRAALPPAMRAHAGAAVLASTVLAITLLQAFRHGRGAAPPSDAGSGAASEATPPRGYFRTTR